MENCSALHVSFNLIATKQDQNLNALSGLIWSDNIFFPSSVFITWFYVILIGATLLQKIG